MAAIAFLSRGAGDELGGGVAVGVRVGGVPATAVAGGAPVGPGGGRTCSGVGGPIRLRAAGGVTPLWPLYGFAVPAAAGAVWAAAGQAAVLRSAAAPRSAASSRLALVMRLRRTFEGLRTFGVATAPDWTTFLCIHGTAARSSCCAVGSTALSRRNLSTISSSLTGAAAVLSLAEGDLPTRCGCWGRAPAGNSGTR